MADGARRSGLADFLRTRRARLSPPDVGLPQGSRRRTPGLRREEVALLADVGITWYTWLEQGRPVRPSAQALEQIARALHLDPDEERHLFALAGRPLPERPGREEVPASLRRLLDGLGPTPAYVTDACWNVLAWNSAFGLVFVDYETLPRRDRNVVYGVFARLGHNRFLADWEGVARQAVGQLRVSYGRNQDDPRFAVLVERCQQVSPEFREWWPRHEVLDRWARRVEYDLPAVGRVAFDYAKSRPAEAPDLWLVINTAVPGTGTSEKLSELVQIPSGQRDEGGPTAPVGFADTF